MLKDLVLKAVYRSESDNILKDFYIPALSVAAKYDRAVGFFSSAALSHAAEGLSAFARAGGKMRLIVGAFVDDKDADAIQAGYDLRGVADALGRQFVEILSTHMSDGLFQKRLEALSYLVGAGLLDVRVALKRQGMYHEKIGIITDSHADQIVFQGSANETVQGLLPEYNFESINVFKCWQPELAEYYQPYISGFERLWQNKVRGTLVIDFPEAAREHLIRAAKECRLPDPQLESELWEQASAKFSNTAPAAGHPSLPTVLGVTPFSLYDHQRKALDEWRKHSLQGILALATGAGKTITSLYGIVRMFESLKRLFVVIAVPYQNLADQWCAVAREFGIIPIQCYGSSADWLDDLTSTVDLFNSRALRFACAVVVNRTLQSDAFQELLASVPGDRLLFIGDECHHHASSAMISALPGHAEFRLGLSATPENDFNDRANERLRGYYGPILFRYTLAQALQDGVLSPYDYHVHLVPLTREEAEEYFELTKKIGVLIAQGSNPESGDDAYLDSLLMMRARLLGSAQNKLQVLRQLLAGMPSQPLTLFYCGDGRVTDEVSGDEVRQIDAISEVLFELGWKTSQFTSREGLTTRRTLLDNFRLAIIDALVAIRCLDEGIDIPGCTTAFLLASSRNKRQFIQRRGRILRKAPGKTHALIHDFVVYNPFPVLPELVEADRSLVAAELARVNEFAESARNPFDSERALAPLLALR